MRKYDLKNYYKIILKNKLLMRYIFFYTLPIKKIFLASSKYLVLEYLIDKKISNLNQILFNSIIFIN